VPDEEAEDGLAWPQMTLAGACVAIGLLPVFLVGPAARAATQALGGLAARGEPTGVANAALGISLAGWGLIALAAAVWGIRWMAVRRRPVRQGATWGCGYSAPTPRMQYTASSFAAPLLQSFGMMSGTHEERSPATFHSRPMDPVLDQLGRPLWRRLAGAASQLRALQTGRIRWYLSYLILTLLGLLLYLGLARAR